MLSNPQFPNTPYNGKNISIRYICTYICCLNSSADFKSLHTMTETTKFIYVGIFICFLSNGIYLKIFPTIAKN